MSAIHRQIVGILLSYCTVTYCDLFFRGCNRIEREREEGRAWNNLACLYIQPMYKDIYTIVMSLLLLLPLLLRLMMEQTSLSNNSIISASKGIGPGFNQHFCIFVVLYAVPPIDCAHGPLSFLFFLFFCCCCSFHFLHEMINRACPSFCDCRWTRNGCGCIVKQVERRRISVLSVDSFPELPVLD